MKTKAIVAIVIVAVLVVGGGIAAFIALGGTNSVSKGDITYNYKVGDSIESFDYITSSDYETYKASSGMMFVPVKVIEKNNNVTKDTYTNTEDGYEMLNSDLDYKCSDGKTYSVYAKSDKYTDTLDNESEPLAKGQSRQITVLVEIPKGTTITGVVWTFSNIKASHDTGLVIDDSIGNYVRGTPSVKFNYQFIESMDSYSYETTDEDHKLFGVKFIQYNNNVADGYTPYYLYTKIICSDGVTYDCIAVSYDYDSELSSKTGSGSNLAFDNSVEYKLIFEVPSTVTTAITGVWDGSGLYSGEYDSTLSFAPE